MQRYIHLWTLPVALWIAFYFAAVAYDVNLALELPPDRASIAYPMVVFALLLLLQAGLFAFPWVARQSRDTQCFVTILLLPWLLFFGITLFELLDRLMAGRPLYARHALMTYGIGISACGWAFVVQLHRIRRSVKLPR